MMHPRSPSARALGLAWVVAAICITAISISACGSADPSAPLAADVAQRADASCVPAPDPGTGITKWNTPIGFALDMFINTSRSSLTVKSVTLIDPHNLILHGAAVYEMSRSQHPLIQEASWQTIGDSIPETLWKRHQAVPGAIIAPGHSVINFRPSPSLNIYEIVPDVSDATPNGGWALGERVTYESGGRTYTVAAYTGMGIGYSPSRGKAYCDAPLNAINNAFKAGR
jgi:hypothetical protein